MGTFDKLHSLIMVAVTGALAAVAFHCGTVSGQSPHADAASDGGLAGAVRADAAGPDAQGDGLARTDSSASDSGGGGGTFAGTSTGGGGSSDVRASDGGLGSRGASAPQPEGATTPGSGGVTSDGGPSGGLRLLQGQLGTLATDAVSGPLRIYHDGIESSERLCVGSICVTGAITP